MDISLLFTQRYHAVKDMLTLGIEDGVYGVAVECVLRRITNQTLVVGERNPGRCNTVALIVGNNVNTTFLLNTVNSRCKHRRRENLSEFSSGEKSHAEYNSPYARVGCADYEGQKEKDQQSVR